MIGRLETIAERRERLLRQHALANAPRMRAAMWARKDQPGSGAIPVQTLEGE